MHETVDCVVIGAGVIGLAIARALAQSSREVLDEGGEKLLTQMNVEELLPAVAFDIRKALDE